MDTNLLLPVDRRKSTVSPILNESGGQIKRSHDLPALLRRLWKVTAPYWCSSDDKAQARLRLAALFILALANTGISVGFSFLSRDFYSALANKDQGQFTKQLLYYLAAFAAGIPNLIVCSRNLEFFTSGYQNLIQILPAAVVAPMYFSGKIEFGVINQSVSAFNHILGDFSIIVNEFRALSTFSAVIDRLGEFDDILDDSTQDQSEVTEKINVVYSNVQSSSNLESNDSTLLDKCHRLLGIESLTLQTPKGKNTLIRELTLEINTKDNLLVTGPSGCGKTSLLRAMADIWSTGRGKIVFYMENEDNQEVAISPDRPQQVNANRRARGIFFLPQRPYMVLGTLRQQLLYPTWSEDSLLRSETTMPTGSLQFLSQPNSQSVAKSIKKPEDYELIQVLEDVRLGDILSRYDGLDSINEWSSVLSLGEQQRLAFARLLLSKPKLVLLDECTSALDEADEEHLYKQMEAAGITYISVGHRRTLVEHHTRNLNITKMGDDDSGQTNWLLKDIKSRTSMQVH